MSMWMQKKLGQLAIVLLALCSMHSPIAAASPDSMLESGKAQGKIPTEIFQPFGASGDAGFEDRCPVGQYMTGLRVRAGSWVDQITLVCSATNSDGKLTGTAPGPARGGNGGGPQESLCKQNEVVSTINIILTNDNRQVQEIDANCRSVAQSNSKPTFLRVGKIAFDGKRKRFNCANGDAATGITGRYGKHLNALGLICSRVVMSPPLAGNGGGGDAALDASMANIETNVDMPGGDYKNFPSSIFTHCRRDCARDATCKAWSWVKPGLQGPQGRCWLKNTVPARVAGNGIVSGVKKGPSQPK